jgi:tyrosyl-tRNA synthetase
VRISLENVFTTLKERGFVEQVTDEPFIIRALEKRMTCYIGFDPTASSLHLGSLVPIMALAHMQRMGHRPIAVVGGGTTLVGDPSGKTEMRPILSREAIESNAEGIKEQLSRFLDFENGKALMVNNADWLVELKYIEFLRDIGRHFSVNRMLAAESYKSRLETGLNFIEFNYMLLQAYDFWHLFKHYNCRLQMGGNDQWGNILAGIDLTRRLEGENVYGITFPLITTSAGIKMGKTHKGAIWLDSNRTSPFEYYQYWINQDDRDIERFLGLFTFLPMKEVRTLGALRGAEIRVAKEVLAYETTKLCHGEVEAGNARRASEELFGKKEEKVSKSVPTVHVSFEALNQGIPAYQLFDTVGLTKTRGEARRLIAQGGGYINGGRIKAFDQVIDTKHMENDETILLRAGKKRFVRVRAVK